MFDHVAIYFGIHLILRSLSIGQINKNCIPSQVGLNANIYRFKISLYFCIYILLNSVCTQHLNLQCMGTTSKSTVYEHNI